MKNMKKAAALLLALIMLLALAACGGSNSGSPSDTSAADTSAADENADSVAGTDADTTDADAADKNTDDEAAPETDGELTTISAGKLTISTSPDFPPFEYTDDSGAIIGIEPEIMTLICDKLGLELQIDAMDFTSALMAAEQGKSDAVVSGVTIREDRMAMYDFTDSYTTITQAIVRPEGSDITMDNLGDYTIGVQSGTTGQEFVEDDFGTDNVVAYDTYSLVFQALLNGQIDCIVMDDAVAKAYLAENPGLEMVETTYEPEEYAFGFTKGNTALVAAVNAALKELIDDGTVQSIIDKYMTE